MHISAGNYVMDQGNPRKPQLRDSLMKGLCDVIVSNGVPFLEMRSVGPHSMSGREKEGKKEGMGGMYLALSDKCDFS